MPENEFAGEDFFPKLGDINRMVHSPARLVILTYLYVVESGDLVYLLRQTGLTWGNLSTHINKLEEAGYIVIEKEFRNRKPHTLVHLTDDGREAFRIYKQNMLDVLGDLPA
ncbi:MAG: transcriptional regulator [Anaerolineaceae bacterium]|nr:transcriptional regulator [Anaerolineaceae bacterium]